MKIKILPKEVYSLIAAGEIIERPASIVRELLQNSIDANAKNIILEIQQGGKDMISVIDDGQGMSKDEISLSIKPHATSKISNSDDLNKISTYGFRGEALHAISRISVLKMESKTQNADIGYGINVLYGKVNDLYEIAMPNGTMVQIKKIFENLPARKKFLKSSHIEMNHCLKEFINHAIANTHINFKFISNNNVMYNLKKESLSDRINNVIGSNFLDNSFYIDYMQYNVHVYGYVGKPDIYSDKRVSISNVFLNSRAIYSSLIRKAIYSAFDTQLHHRYLPFLIMLEMSPDMFDINVHPSKKEVKFRNENMLFPLIINAVKSAIQVNTAQNKKIIDYEFPKMNNNANKASQETLFNTIDFEIMGKKQLYNEKQNIYFWQYANTYIITELKKELIIIDQHAAHERIMYEKYRSSKEIIVQNLLFAQTIKLEAELMDVFIKNKKYLEENGFTIRLFGNDIVLLEGVPSIMNSNFTIDDFILILKDMQIYKNINKIDDIYKILACRTSIKAGVCLSQMEMAEIFKELFNCDNPYACPHGRPTIKHFNSREIEKWFNRT